MTEFLRKVSTWVGRTCANNLYCKDLSLFSVVSIGGFLAIRGAMLKVQISMMVFMTVCVCSIECDTGET